MFSKQYKDVFAADKIIPDGRHKTQVVVNSEGKISEATRNVKKSLKKRQIQPTEKQVEKQEKQKKKTVKKKPKA